MLDFSSGWEERYRWWSMPLGQAFLSAESEELSKIIPTLFGYHFLLLGEEIFMGTLSQSPILHRVWSHPMLRKLTAHSGLTARHDKLPIASDCIDAMYLAHCLEFMNNPHEVLRETFRVLIPEGYVVISGFNPWSWWGLWRYIMRLIKRTPWDGCFISIARLKDWLALLGFDVVQVSPYFFSPPFSHPRILRHLKWLEKLGRYCWPFLAGGYLVLARKRIITLTPIKPAFENERKLAVQEGIAEPVRFE